MILIRSCVSTDAFRQLVLHVGAPNDMHWMPLSIIVEFCIVKTRKKERTNERKEETNPVNTDFK